VQVPEVSSEAVQIETVQMAGVVEEKLTKSPELAVAASAVATDVLRTCDAMGLNAIV
jgi:hypothetical protein